MRRDELIGAWCGAEPVLSRYEWMSSGYAPAMIRAKVYSCLGTWRVGFITTDPLPHTVGRPRRCLTCLAMRVARKTLRILA